MLHLSTVESTTLELLKKLQQLPVLCNTRLVGGTALALQLGHRKSVDLDFFGQINVDSQDLKEALRTLGTLTILNDSKNIHIYVLNEVKIDIVNYTYPWLDDVVYKDGIRLASPRDIAAMKITAIEGRLLLLTLYWEYFIRDDTALHSISSLPDKSAPRILTESFDEKKSSSTLKSFRVLPDTLFLKSHKGLR